MRVVNIHLRAILVSRNGRYKGPVIFRHLTRVLGMWLSRALPRIRELGLMNVVDLLFLRVESLSLRMELLVRIE